jgi:single-strand DNA-binding protein
MNKITLIGNLTHDPEVRSTPNGVTVCTFTIAVNRRFAPQGGERQTDFFRINAWRQLGETCARYLSKGRKVAVLGELQARTYEAKDGTTRMSLDVSADEVEFLSPKSQDDASGGGYTAPTGGAKAADSQDLSGFADVQVDDIPF